MLGGWIRAVVLKSQPFGAFVRHWPLVVGRFLAIPACGAAALPRRESADIATLPIRRRRVSLT